MSTPVPAPKPWYESKTNIAAILTLVINLLNALLVTPIIPPNVLAVISGVILPALVFVLRTWFTDAPTTQPFLKR